MPEVIQRALLLGLLTLPWLWPYTYGPSAGVEPYLASAALAAVALALWPARGAVGDARVAAWAWLAAALASSLIALLQYFDLETPFYPWINIAEPGRAFGNLRQPNQLATLLVIGALALRGLVQDGRLSWRLAAGLCALLVAALAATASRVGLVELLACGALLSWWARGAKHGRRAVLAVGGAAALYALAVLALPVLAQMTEGIVGRDMVERLRTAESTCGSRLILYDNVLHLIGLKPWTGWGWGELDYAHYITLYDGPRFCHILDNAHNLPLHLAVELGVPAALLACALAAWLIWRGQPWAEAQPARQLAWGVLLAIGIHSLVEYPLWYGPFQIAVAICVWLLWATRAGAEARALTPRPWPRLTAAALMLCAIAYAGWDYHRISQVYLPAEQRSVAYRDNPMAQARKSRLYAGAVRFAEVSSQPVTRDNADWTLQAALQALHFSPEPRVIIKVIESATLLGQDDLARTHLARFRAAFAREHQAWADTLMPKTSATSEPDTSPMPP
ncbi:MAG: Wzy polymerase domain-containing protein [Burkholderiaceae bacterium]|jgi:O-antigen ligase|nr:Wzy polymerase domain-containing protein [Burkholderiaceae bacterium]